MPELKRYLLPGYDRDNGQAGVTAPSMNGLIGANQTLTANRAYYMRFVPSRAMRIASIKFVLVTPSGTDDPVDVGIYDASGARLVSSGATTGKLNASAGAQSVPVTATTLAGAAVYYAAISANSTATLLGASTGVNLAVLYGSTIPLCEIGIQAAAHPLPATMTLSNTTASVPGVILALIEG